MLNNDQLASLLGQVAHFQQMTDSEVRTIIEAGSLQR
jgi:hypothetical protein